MSDYGLLSDPYAWRSSANIPGGIPTGGYRQTDLLRPGPEPTGSERVSDWIRQYLPANALGDRIRSVAAPVISSFGPDYYDMGQNVARGGNPGMLAASLIPGMRPATKAVQAAAGAGENVLAGGIRMFRGSSEFSRPVGRREYWGSTSPDIANMYATAGKGGKKPTNPVVTEVEARFKNPLEIDARGEMFYELPATPETRRVAGDGERYSIDDIADFAKDAGHDGLVVRNVVDAPGYGDANPTTTVAALKRGTVFDPHTGNLIYSAVPAAFALSYPWLWGNEKGDLMR